MSSSPLSSKRPFVQNQAQLFNRQNGTLIPTMNVARNSPGPSSSSTTRIVAPRPFYRSQVTPDPFDYSNNSRREADHQQNLQNRPQRRYSSHQINAIDNDDDAAVVAAAAFISSSDESLSLEFPPPPTAFLTPSITDDGYQFSSVKSSTKNPILCRSDSGSSLSNSYLSDHEPSPPTISMHPHYHQQYRSTNNNNRALISVSSTQSPLITIASAGSPSRSEIRVSSSPKTTKSTLREIRISRPDSPTISINRTGNNQPITFTSNTNGGTITNGSGGAFHISVGTPANAIQRDTRGRTSPSFHQIEPHRDSIDNRYTSNVVANRFKPSMAFTSPNSNTFDRSSAIVNLPPPSSPTSLTMRGGHLIRKEQSDVDHLTKLLMKSMNSSNEPNFFGMCARCNDEIVGEENGLVAMDRMYHVSCFTCTMCGCRLRGMHFYSMENKPYCEPCYINSLEKCVVCTQPITDRILRATGKPYHAQCFACVACQKSLDGVPFTVDATMQIHCIDCFHQKFAPRCFACHRPILPVVGQEETVRIVALDRSYHIDCYRCENCKIQFTSEEGCYPIDDHIFCVQCNLMYSRTMLGHS